MQLLSLIVLAPALGVLAWAGHPWLYLWLWLLPSVTVLPLLGQVRAVKNQGSAHFVLVDTGLLFACAMRLFPVASHILVRGLAWSITSGMVLAWMVWATPTGTASSTGRPSTSMLLSSAVCALMWCGYHLQLLRPKKP